MPQLREAGSDTIGVEISETDVHFLRTHLETMSQEATAFYIDAVTIEILAEDHAPSLLINRLREILNRRDCADVELAGAASPTEDEIAGIIDRRAGNESAEPVCESETVTVAGRELKCVVCRSPQFRHRLAPLHSAVASFPDGEGLGPTAHCYVCAECGYVHWFMP